MIDTTMPPAHILRKKFVQAFLPLDQEIRKALEKEKWYIETYHDFNRVKAIAELLKDTDIGWGEDNVPSEEYFPLYSGFHIYRKDKGIEIGTCVSGKNLTQMFNEYLELCNCSVWASSIVNAMINSWGVEKLQRGHSTWEIANGTAVNFSDYRYRIGHTNEITAEDRKVLKHKIDDSLSKIKYYLSGLEASLNDGSDRQIEFFLSMLEGYAQNIKLNYEKWAIRNE